MPGLKQRFIFKNSSLIYYTPKAVSSSFFPASPHHHPNPHPHHSSSLSLQKWAGLPGLSTKHGISSCNKTRSPPSAEGKGFQRVHSVVRSPTRRSAYTTITTRFPDYQFSLGGPVSPVGSVGNTKNSLQESFKYFSVFLGLDSIL